VKLASGLVLLLLLAAVGVILARPKRVSSPPDPGCIIRLADRLPAAAPRPDAGGKILVFDADLQAATAVKGIAKLEASKGVLHAALERGGEPAIDFPVRAADGRRDFFDATEVDAIELEMRPAGGRARPRLFWLREGETEPVEDCAVSFPWRFDGRMERGLAAVGGLLPWRGRIRTLRLVPTDGDAEVTIARIAGYRLPPPETGRARLTIGVESRDAILTAETGAISFVVVPGAGARLEFGIGVPTDAWNRTGGPVTFDVSLDGRERFRRALDPRVNAADREWVDASIDLSRHEGRSVRIRFGVAFAENETCPRAAIGAPVVHEPSRRDGGGGKSPGGGVRHVILVSLETLRADHLSCYGYGAPTSPRIDALAAEGVRFETAMANSPETLMSHATLFTSLLPSAHGHAKSTQRLSSRLPTLAEALRDAGFLTAAFVGNGFLAAIFGYENGFDRYDDGAPRADLLKYDTERSFLRAIDFVTGHPDRDTFTFLHTYEIHTAYAPPPHALALFADSAYSGKVGSVFRLWPDALELFGGGEPDERDVKQVVALYDAEVRYADALVGRLLDAIRRSGLEDRTLVVLLSDHGEEFMEHGTLANHGHTLYEEMLRIPLILRGPGLGRGKVVRGVVSQIDVAPTILEYLGIAPPETFRGESLLEAMRTGERRGGVAISEDLTTYRRASLRRDGSRYVRTRNIERRRTEKLLADHPEIRKAIEPIYLRLVREEYYDLASDPGERRNAARARARECAEDRAALAAALDEAHRFRLEAGGPDAAVISGALVRHLHAIGYFGASGFDAEIPLPSEIAEESEEEPEASAPER